MDSLCSTKTTAIRAAQMLASLLAGSVMARAPDPSTTACGLSILAFSFIKGMTAGQREERAGARFSRRIEFDRVVLGSFPRALGLIAP